MQILTRFRRRRSQNEYKCNNPYDNRLCRSLGRLRSIVRDSVQTQQKRKIVKSILSTLFSLSMVSDIITE